MTFTRQKGMVGGGGGSLENLSRFRILLFLKLGGHEIGNFLWTS